MPRSRTTWTGGRTIPRPLIVTGWDRARGRIDSHALSSGATARIATTSDAIARWTASLSQDAPASSKVRRRLDRPGDRSAAGQRLHWPLVAALSERGIGVASVNPRQRRACARAHGVLAGTDPARARILAGTGRRRPLEATVAPDADRMRLADRLRRRRKPSVEMRKTGKGRRPSAAQRWSLREIETMIAPLAK